jgi:hypothetical protein
MQGEKVASLGNNHARMISRRQNGSVSDDILTHIYQIKRFNMRGLNKFNRFVTPRSRIRHATGLKSSRAPLDS